MSGPSTSSLLSTPVELLLLILCFVDVPELLATSRTCHRLRNLSLDPLLHHSRLRNARERMEHLLLRRPNVQALTPPAAGIYLTRTHQAARRLHWSLVSIRLNRSLQRRPKISTLLSANILPKECCRIDRRSGDIVWGVGVAGPLVERKRRLERESLKESLRARLERKAFEIKERRRETTGVGILIWRFSRRLRISSVTERLEHYPCEEWPNRGKVSGLRRFWEELGGVGPVVAEE